MTDILDIPCTVDEVWHSPELGCCTPLFPSDRAGTVQTVDDRVRDAILRAGRSSDPQVWQVAVSLVKATGGAS